MSLLNWQFRRKLDLLVDSSSTCSTPEHVQGCVICILGSSGPEACNFFLIFYESS
jgi:hypothetical protein